MKDFTSMRVGKDIMILITHGHLHFLQNVSHICLRLNKTYYYYSPSGDQASIFYFWNVYGSIKETFLCTKNATLIQNNPLTIKRVWISLKHLYFYGSTNIMKEYNFKGLPLKWSWTWSTSSRWWCEVCHWWTWRPLSKWKTTLTQSCDLSLKFTTMNLIMSSVS